MIGTMKVYFSNKATPPEFVRKEPRVVHERWPITYHFISPERMEIMFNRKRKIPKVFHQIWIGPLDKGFTYICMHIHSLIYAFVLFCFVCIVSFGDLI
jgi:hypothetical protein